MAAGKSEFGVCGVVGGMMVIELLAGTMRSVSGRIAAVGNENNSGNLLWQSRLTLSFLELMTSGYNRTCTEGHDSFGGNDG